MGAVLVMNAGSTSVKLAVVGDDGAVSPLASADEAPAGLAAVGHRIVHGGERFREPAVLDDAMVEALEGLSALAPLHNGPALRIVREARRRFPGVPHVVGLRHRLPRDHPQAAATYAVPRGWREKRPSAATASTGSRGSGTWPTAALLARPTRLITLQSAAGPRRPPSSTAARSTPPWASARSRVSSWPSAPGRSTRTSAAPDPRGAEGSSAKEAWLMPSTRTRPDRPLRDAGDMREVEAAATPEPGGQRPRGLLLPDPAAVGSYMAVAGRGWTRWCSAAAWGSSAGLRSRAARRLAFFGVALDPGRNTG